jgi:Mg2+/Co2+ transporter CorB
MPPDMDLTLALNLLAIAALLVISAFFSCSETALTAASQGKLRARADRGSKGAETALAVKEDNERLIGAILLGNNFANTASAAVATALLTQVFTGGTGIAVATVIMTFTVLIFSEVLPKTYAITRPEPTASFVAPVIRLLILLFSPVVNIVRAIVRVILRLFGVRTNPGDHVLAIREEIAGALALGHESGAVEKEHRDRLLGALDLDERTVEEIMRHRSQIEMLDAEAEPGALITAALASSHSRLPLFKDTRENIVGVIHAKDLLRAVEKFLRTGDGQLDSVSDLDILSVAMKPYFIPDTTPLDEQMREFLKRRTHFALVVDEYGDLKGLITLEDILEEIVGEITDEFDIDAEHPLKQSDTGDVMVDGAMTIRDFNRATDWDLPDEAANTIAGLVIHEAQMIPAEGQVFSFHGFRFEVLARKDNRVTRIKVRPLGT